MIKVLHIGLCTYLKSTVVEYGREYLMRGCSRFPIKHFYLVYRPFEELTLFNEARVKLRRPSASWIVEHGEVVFRVPQVWTKYIM